jgi:guanylate kinase
MPSRIYIISGTIASGKDSVLKRLKEEPGFYWLRSVTSRSMRKGEKQGDPYYFVGKNVFEKMIRNDKFFEYSMVYGCYYGITREEFEKAEKSGENIFFRVDKKGTEKIKQIFPEATSIFIAPPSVEEIKKRIGQRGDRNTKRLGKRIVSAGKEIKEAVSCYDFIIINYKIEDTVKKILKIVFN